jgi:hypothetical protein
MELLTIGIIGLAWLALLSAVVALCAVAGRADRREARLRAGHVPSARLASRAPFRVAVRRAYGARLRTEHGVRPLIH